MTTKPCRQGTYIVDVILARIISEKERRHDQANQCNYLHTYLLVIRLRCEPIYTTGVRWRDGFWQTMRVCDFRVFDVRNIFAKCVSGEAFEK
jgi:hypothetical protein